MPALRTLSPADARRLAISCQRLAGPGPSADSDGIMDVLRDLRCLQIDPIRAVEYTQRTVLWSRLGTYDPVLLDQLLFDERRLFEYWAHCASIVLTEDYPIHATRMRHHRDADKANNDWLAANHVMVQYIVERLRAEGPLSSDKFEDKTAVPWRSSGWNDNRVDPSPSVHNAITDAISELAGFLNARAVEYPNSQTLPRVSRYGSVERANIG